MYRILWHNKKLKCLRQRLTIEMALRIPLASRMLYLTLVFLSIMNLSFVLRLPQESRENEFEGTALIPYKDFKYSKILQAIYWIKFHISNY